MYSLMRLWGDAYSNKNNRGHSNEKVLCSVFLLLIIVSSMVCCSNTAKTKSSYEATEVENVSMSISAITPTGAKLIIKDTSEKPNAFGQWFVLETKSDSDWYELQTKIENYGFNEVAYLPNENGEVHLMWIGKDCTVNCSKGHTE